MGFKSIQPALPMPGLKEKRKRDRSKDYYPGTGGVSFEDRGDSSLRALTVMQPWAWAIANEMKDYENREWVFPYYWLNMPFAIHAGGTFHSEGYERFKSGEFPLTLPLPKQHELQ